MPRESTESQQDDTGPMLPDLEPDIGRFII